MRPRSIVLVLAMTLAIIGAAVSMRGQGAGAFHRWLPAIHGHGGR